MLHYRVQVLLLLLLASFSWQVTIIDNESFYETITDTEIKVYTGSDITLDPASGAYVDPSKDFHLQAVNVTIRGHYKIKKSFTIVADNINVDGDVVVDASGEDGTPDFANKERAADGATAGAKGSDGLAGGIGNSGHDITIHAKSVSGGVLTLVSNGGKGGQSQSGGNGAIGSVGPANGDADACCHHRPVSGGAGGRGGDGGLPGKVAAGGNAGAIKVLVTDTNSTKHVVLIAKGGVGGLPGAPGAGGAGGPGGASSNTKCHNDGHAWDHHWRCHPPQAPPGPSGANGNPGTPTTSGPNGADGNQQVTIGSMKDIGDAFELSQRHLALFEGDSAYKNGDPEKAAAVYDFIRDISRNNSDPEISHIALYSNAKLVQMSRGLDFWGNVANFVPQLSAETIFKYLHDIVIPYLRDIENEYQKYFAKETKVEERLELAKNTIQKNNDTLQLMKKEDKDLEESLVAARKEIDVLIPVQTRWIANVHYTGPECKQAINIKLTKEKYKIGFTDVVNIVIAGVKLVSGVTDGISDVKKIMDFGKHLVDGDFKNFDTIMKNISAISDDVSKNKGTIITNYEAIKKLLEKPDTKHSGKIVVDGDQFDKAIDDWLYLPACNEFKTSFNELKNISQVINDKILQHDTTLVKKLAMEAQMGIMQKESERLQSKITKITDPTAVEFTLVMRRTYRYLKSLAVDLLHSLQAAHNVQFLTQVAFRYDDRSVTQLEAYMANLAIITIQRWEERGSRSQQYNINTKPMTDTIVLNAKKYPDLFKRIQAGDNATFVLSGSVPQMEALADVRMKQIRVYVPQVISPTKRVTIWFNRHGFSQFFDTTGRSRVYAHAPRSYLSTYNTEDYSVIHGIDEKPDSQYADLSPFGPWTISIPAEYNPGIDLSKVTEIHLQLGCTFLPCSTAICPIRTFIIPHNVTATKIETVEKTITLERSFNASVAYTASFDGTVEFNATATKSVQKNGYDVYATVNIARPCYVNYNVTKVAWFNAAESHSASSSQTRDFTAIVGVSGIGGESVEQYLENAAFNSAAKLAGESALKAATKDAETLATKKASTRALEIAKSTANQEAQRRAKELAEQALQDYINEYCFEQVDSIAQDMAEEQAAKKIDVLISHQTMLITTSIIVAGSLVTVAACIALVTCLMRWRKKQSQASPQLYSEL
jgi:hypothetical protein